MIIVKIKQPREGAMNDPHADLEMLYIQDHLQGRGFTLEAVKELPEPQRKRLWAAATQYASCKLAEVETRAYMVMNSHSTPGVRPVL